MKIVREVLVAPIRLYRYCISPLFPPSCRFSPSCSSYAQEALLTHGLVRGGLLTLWRLLRCNPWSKGGFDPVPPVISDHPKTN